MRILIITDHLETGGVATITSKLTEGFLKLGHSPHILTLYKRPTCIVLNHTTSLDITYFQRRLLLPILLKINYHLKHNTYDLIIAQKDHVAFWVTLAKIIAKIKTPLLVNSHTTVSRVYSTTSKYTRKIMLRLCSHLYKHADYVCNVSRGSAFDSQTFFNIAKVHYLPNPVISTIDQSIKKTNPFRINLKKNILACGRLTSSKNYELMLKAFAIASTKRKDMHLTILGDGELRNELSTLALNLGISDQVTFEGNVSNPLDYMAFADCIWMTSYYEGSPTVLIEALSQGCPVLSVDCPHGPKEILQNGKYGTLIATYDPNDHADALLQVINTQKQPLDYYHEAISKFEITSAANNYIKLQTDADTLYN